jgi:hypothetical protein
MWRMAARGAVAVVAKAGAVRSKRPPGVVLSRCQCGTPCVTRCPSSYHTEWGHA